MEDDQDLDGLSPDSSNEKYVEWFMQHSFGKKPRDLQVKPCAALLAMAESMGDSYPSTYVLIAPTSTGKSLIRDTIARILFGVYWTICPLLSLSADQTEKLNEYKEQYGDNGIRPIHIDEIEEEADIKALTTKLLAMEQDTNRCAALFSSPQAFEKPWVLSLFDKLLEKGILRLFCVDEVHIAVRHALTFRSVYTPLKKKIFDKLQYTRDDKKPEQLLIPVLLMTATASRSLIMDNYPKLSGHTVLPNNISWPLPKYMKRRDVFIDINFGQQHMSNFKSALKNIMEQPEKKAIFYNSFRQSLITQYDDVRNWLDENCFHSHDVVMVHGEMTNKEKFYNINVFTGKDKLRIPTDGYELFQARLLMATESANAGVDDAMIFLVFHFGLISCFFDVLQELGRAGRRVSSLTGPHTDRYIARFHLMDFVAMYRRTIRIRKSEGLLPTAKAKEYALGELMHITTELVLPTSCFHQRFEWLSSNPFTRPKFDIYLKDSEPCVNACCFCTGERKERALKRSTFPSFLLDLFVKHSGSSLTLPDNLPKKMCEIENGTHSCFHKGQRGSFMQPSDAKLVVLQMIAAGILLTTEKYVEKDDEYVLTTSLAQDDDVYRILIDHYWQRIPHVVV
jgi:hypothetical protein